MSHALVDNINKKKVLTIFIQNNEATRKKDKAKYIRKERAENTEGQSLQCGIVLLIQGTVHSTFFHNS